MFEEGEAKSCPVCGMELAKLHKLPLSHDAAVDEAGVPTAPEVENFAWLYLGRGRGGLVACAVIGLALFFMPWVHMTSPYIDTFTGLEMAKRTGWLWAPLAAWVVLVPTVASRRTIVQLRGARVAAAFLSAISAVAVGILLGFPQRAKYFTVAYTFQPALFGTLVLSLVAVVLSLRLGGRVDDIKVSRGTSKGETVH